jgi:hypothetical protein
MSTPKKSSEVISLRAEVIELVMSLIREERETLSALACSILMMVSCDPKNPKDGDNIHAYRLAELLEDEIGSSHTENLIRELLKVPKP